MASPFKSSHRRNKSFILTGSGRNQNMQLRAHTKKCAKAVAAGWLGPGPTPAAFALSAFWSFHLSRRSPSENHFITTHSLPLPGKASLFNFKALSLSTASLSPKMQCSGLNQCAHATFSSAKKELRVHLKKKTEIVALSHMYSCSNCCKGCNF